MPKFVTHLLEKYLLSDFWGLGDTLGGRNVAIAENKTKLWSSYNHCYEERHNKQVNLLNVRDKMCRETREAGGSDELLF